MAVYLLYFFILILFCGLSYREARNQTFIGMSILLWLFIGLRGKYVGTDTLGYLHEYLSYENSSLKDMIELYWNKEKSEPLYLLFMWLLTPFSFFYTIMLSFWALFPAIGIRQLQQRELKYNCDITLSYIVFFLLGFFVFFVAGIRQTTAISMALIAYRYLKEPAQSKIWKDSNAWKFFFCIGVGYLVHNSILIFAVVYPVKGWLQNIRIKWWYIVPVLALFPISKMVNITHIQVVSQFFFNDTYWQYGDTYESSWSASAFIMQLILFLICFIARNRLIENDHSNILLLNLVLIGLIFQSMAGTLAEMARVSYYFSIFYLILLPKAIRILSDYGRNSIVIVGFVFLSFAYLFFLTSTNLPEYHFFWENFK